MQQLGFRSVFAKLFASVMLALILFAIAMVLLTQLVHDKDAGIRSEVVATQILGQIDPFLQELNVAVSKDNRLQARFMLAVVKKSFDIFDESLQAKMGLYDNTGHLLMQTDNSDLPLELPDTPSLLTRVFPSFSDTPATQQAQVYSSTGYTLLYESRLTPKKPALSAALNLFTGTLLLLLIMAGVLWLIARTMTWRINQMSQQMAQLGDGDFTVRVNSRGNDEIASLARGFNQAAQKIEHLVNANSLLLAHASHELRTPITRIRLQIEMMDMLARSMPNDIKEKFDKRAQAINRDLSGLNDLVESILLVSRLDAGHAMQQIERVDFYDLINQERQHYSEATLIGEHIVIDGQPAMLTHLIRNLLNNAMLHGVPPVTVLLYGVQDRADADTIPDYLLQSIVDSSFADYNCLTDADEDTLLDTSLALLNDDSDTADNVTKSKSDPLALGEHLDDQNALSAPVIYRNGETLTPPSDDEKGPGQLVSPKTVDSASGATFDTSTRNDEGDADTSAAVKEPRFSAASHGVSTEVMALDKAIFSPAPDDTSISLLTDTTTAQSVHHNAKADGADKPDGLNDNDANNEPRKESLFLKHLKKTKPEPARPLPKYAVLAVIDEGAGIPEDKREEIFSPFVRLQQKNKGSGLGLSLVSQIVSAHQGRIINDTINGHTRFLVILPVKHDPHYHSLDEHD